MEYLVRNMELAEIEIANYLAYKEGWNPGKSDGIVIYNTDKNGFFIAEHNNQVVGCISAVKYSIDYGFIGFYIVDNEHRKSPAGLMLALKALCYLKDCNIGINGIISKIKKYEKIGFKLAYKNFRYQGVGGFYKINNKIFKTSVIDFNEICEYDRNCFPAERRSFLEGWLNMVNSSAYVYYDRKVCGYGVIRACKNGFKIGPLFADNFTIAEEIFKALSNKAVDELIFLDIPEVNPYATDLAKKYEMKKIFETARMYSEYEPMIDYFKVFGITTFELG